MDEREHLEKAIAELEAQRATMGDATVDAAVMALKARLEALHPPEVQRKYVTILFADVVGFTRMSEEADPEEVRDFMNETWRRLDTVVLAQGGTIDKHIGDALMAVFGVPVSRVDDAERAVRAAFEMQRALRALAQESDWTKGLQMRIGLHSGLIAWGNVGTREERTAMGDAVNLASRIEQAAPVGGVLASEETCRHLREGFEQIERPPLHAKGKSKPVLVREIRPRRVSRRHEVPRAGASPLVGRSETLEHLSRVFEAVVDDRAPAVQPIVGEAGVGKSRVLAEFVESLRTSRRAPRCVLVAAPPADWHVPFALLREVFTELCDIHPADPPVRQRARLLAGVEEAVGREASALVENLAQLLGLERDERRPALDYQELARDAVIRFFQDLAGATPVVLALDDVHAADEASIELLRLVVGRCSDRPLLVVCCARDAVAAGEWERLDQHPRAHPPIRLEGLDAGASRELVDRLLGDDAVVPPELAGRLADSSGGNPFYLAELVRLLTERGAIVRERGKWVADIGALEGTALPGTVQAVLQARLDDLGAEERDVIERAAVVGVAFSSQAVTALGQDGEAVPVGALDALCAARLIRRLPGSAPEDRLSFESGLLRQVTYEGIPRRRRARWHRAAARWLIADPSGPISQPAVVGGHFEACGELERAFDWYLRGAHASFRAAALPEATALYRRALSLPVNGSERSEDRLDAWKRLAVALRQAGRVEEAEQACSRLASLAEGTAAWEARAALELARLHLHRSSWALATEPLERAARQAEQAADPDLIAQAACERARLMRLSGKFESSLEACQKALAVPGLPPETVAEIVIERGRACYRTGRFEEASSSYGEAVRHAEEAGATLVALRARAGLAMTLLEEERLGEARAEVGRLLSDAQQTGHRRVEAASLELFAEIDRCEGKLESAREGYLRVLELQKAIESPSLPVTQMNLAYCDMERGDYEAAARRLESLKTTPAARPALLAARAVCAVALGDVDGYDAFEAEMRAAQDEAPVIERDLARLTELAGDLCQRLSYAARADRAWRFSLGLWKSLDRDVDARRVEEKLSLAAAPTQQT